MVALHNIDTPSSARRDAGADDLLTRRVALLTNYVTPYFRSTFEALAGRVGRLRVFVSTPMEPNRPWRADWGTLDVTVQKTLTVNGKWRHPSGFSDRLYVHVPLDTVSLLRRFAPDLVISHELGMRTLQAMLWCKLARRGRLIIWVRASEHTEHGRGRMRAWLRRMILPRADAVLVNGPSGARYVLRFGVPAERIFTWVSVIDVSPFLALPLDRPPADRRRLLFSGQLIARKGIVPFLKALARWAGDHSDRGIDMLVVGDGALRAEVEGLAVPPNLSLTFVGNVGYADVVTFYGGSGIFVFPTLADEWGVVVNEALAAGLPILGSLYSQAVEDLVEDGRTGWIFRPDDPDSIYDAIDRMFATPDTEIEIMRRNCREEGASLVPELAAEQVATALRFALGAAPDGRPAPD